MALSRRVGGLLCSWKAQSALTRLYSTSPAFMPQQTISSRGSATQDTKVVKKSILYDEVLNKLINTMMYDGKKATAEAVIYDMLEQIKREAAGANAAVASRVGDPMDVVLTAIEHAKPLIETRPVRVGGTIYQVPTPVPPARRQSLAVKWIVRAARDRKSPHKMSERLYKEIMDCYNMNADGNVMRKRNEVHKQAESNRAYAHFRWW